MSIVDNIKIRQNFGDKYDFEYLSEYETRSGITKIAELPEEYKDYDIVQIWNDIKGRLCVAAMKEGKMVLFTLINENQWVKGAIGGLQHTDEKYKHLIKEFEDIRQMTREELKEKVKQEAKLVASCLSDSEKIAVIKYEDAIRQKEEKKRHKKKLTVKLDITEFDKRIMDSVIDVYDGIVLRTNWLNDTVDDATQMTRTDISELEDKFDEIIRKLKHEITYKD